MKSDKSKSKPMVFICEYCEKEFSEKEACISHKKQHMHDFSVSQRKKSGNKKRRTGPYPSPKQRKNSCDSQSGSLNQDDQGRTTPSKQGEGQWNNPSTHGSSSSTSTGKLPGPMSPKTGDTPAAADPPAGQGAEMGGERMDDSDIQLSEETLRHLSQFSDEQILAELAARQEAHVCVCGTVFRDQTLYYLHRSTHNTNNPKKCSQCDFVARDWYDFTSHFFIHRKAPSKTS